MSNLVRKAAESHHRSKRRSSVVFRSTALFFDRAAGLLLCLLLIATPWLFGTTELWAVRLINLGSFLVAACCVVAGFQCGFQGAVQRLFGATRRERVLALSLLGLNLLVIAFCILSLYNARATFSLADQSFRYHEGTVAWLPSTYDTNATRQFLVNVIAWFLAFWSARFWLRAPGANDEIPSPSRNRRLKALLWVLSINGFLLAIQGMFQRLSGSSKLLWFRDSYYRSADFCFGPFSYRGNAAEYMNLIWPVALGLFWLLYKHRHRHDKERGRAKDGPELLLIPMALLMIVAVFFSLSRGGAVVALGSLLAILAVVTLQKRVPRGAKIALLVIVVFAVLGGNYLMRGQLKARFQKAFSDNLSGRPEIYQNARKIAADFPLFGVGPGAFSSVYQLYRESSKQLWHAFAHDDWLETRVTMGWLGFTIVLLNLILLIGWILSSGSPAVPWIFTALVSLGLLGCLVHAKFDFPFQTYSIFYTFIAIAAILTSVSPARK